MPIPTSMSAACRRQIVEPCEGRRLVAYRDCVGVLTIGYGHTSRAGPPQVTPGMKITQAEADDILSRDLAVFERGVAALIAGAKGGVTQCEFDALVDLAFNVGLGNLKSSSLLRAFRAGDKAGAARKFMDWNKAGGRVIAGLTQRRQRDRAWFLTGRPITGAVGLIDAGASFGRQSSPETTQADMAHALDHPDRAPARAVILLLNERMETMKGYRTILVGLALAIVPAALQYLGAVDWANLIGPTGAFVVSGLVAIAMRAITTTPMGKSGGVGQ